MNPEPLITLRGISKNYRSVRALEQIELEMGTGITGLLGPNGAGKSTLIKILLGLVRSTSGRGLVLGLDLHKQGRQIRQRVGYVPEDDCYIPGLTGVEVVRFAAALAGIPPVEGLRRAHEILDYCGMKQERYRTIESYSTGMRQKIKFAAALVHDPQILILDEPTSGLDPEERESLLARIRHLVRTADKSVLLSTHILPDVQTTCQRVVILAGGRVRLNQSIEEVNRPASGMATVSVLGDPQPLLQQLRAASINHELADNGEIRLRDGGVAVRERIWAIAREQGILIDGLRPARNSLEEVFLAAVQETRHASP